MKACSFLPWYPKQGSLSSPAPMAGQDAVWQKSGINPCSSTLLLARHSFGDRHPALSPKKRGIWSKPATHRLHIQKERKRHLWGQVLVHPADRCCPSCSLVCSAGWALHQHTGILLTFQPHLSHGLLGSLSYLVKVLYKKLSEMLKQHHLDGRNGIGRGVSNISYSVD